MFEVSLIFCICLLPFSAILELKNRLDFSVTVKPICMPYFINRPYHNTKATIAGFGKQAGYNYNSQLKEAPVEIWSQEFCTRIMDAKWSDQPWHEISE